MKEIVGDVDGFICFMVDDECLTAKTTIGDGENLIAHGAKEVDMVITHMIANDNEHASGWATLCRSWK